MSYTFLIGKTTVSDEIMSRFFTDYYNLFLDVNFFKFYHFQNHNLLCNDNKLMFLEKSSFLSKWVFIYTIGGQSDGSPIGLKRSPTMTKRNITMFYS